MIARLLASRTNRALAAGLFVLLVLAPLAGFDVPIAWQLVGGNFTNVTGYLAASIAAGASAVNLHEGRKHRKAAAEHRDTVAEHLERQCAAEARRERHLAQIRAHLAAARTLRPEQETPAP